MRAEPSVAGFWSLFNNNNNETRLYHVPVALQNIYGCNDKRGENGDGNENEISGGGGDSGDYLALYMQMTWFCVVCRRKT